MSEKTVFFNFKLSKNMKAMLKTDAHNHQMTKAEYIRYLITKEHQEAKK